MSEEEIVEAMKGDPEQCAHNYKALYTSHTNLEDRLAKSYLVITELKARLFMQYPPTGKAQ